MAFTPNLTNTFFLVALLVVLLPAETYAFGAGDIPDFAYLNDKAFRHGDIENILETLVKSSGAAIGGSSLLGFASSVIKHASGGSKFTKSDVKKVYFGNWLRDYSQAMDIAGLSKLSADTLVLIVAVLGFMTFGFASDEFQVTADRLGVYLPVEHIDNPKGYAEKEGDARQFHPKLRPPVSPRELEIDQQTGMKKYIATENQGWDTSTAFIRRTFRSCIEHGRRARGKEGSDLWEAYRLLGTGLHTMEDLLAHSNWCELALRKMGHSEVFCHVGDNVTVNTPNGQAPPLVTGTFGSADFMHSVLGEAGDKLSQASVTALSAKMENGSQGKTPDMAILKNILAKLGGGEDKLEQGENIKKQSEAYHFDPNNIAPPEVQKQLLDLLKWHDDIFRSINQKIEMVPGLSNLLDEFSNALNEYIYTILAPYLGPILTQATGVLNEGSKAVIESDDQYEVFNDPNASDPSHSLLSKDHFGLILNEPAGKIAQVVVENSVNLIVKGWSSNDEADEIIDQILEAFHHPYYATGRSAIQEKMMDHMQRWVGSLGSEASEIINSLTKESVRDNKNKRPGLDSDVEEAGYAGCGHSHKTSKPTAYSANTGGYSPNQSTNTYNASSTYTSSQSQYKSETYGEGRTSASSDNYGSRRRDDDDDNVVNYGQHGRPEISAYDGQAGYGGQKRHNQAYSGYDREDNRESNKHGYQSSQGGERPSHQQYGQQSTGYAPAYSQPEESRYGRQTDDSFGRHQATTNYGGHGRTKKDDSDDEKKYRPSYGQNSGGGGNDYGRSSKKDQSDSDDEKKKKKHGRGHRDDSDDDDKPRRQQEGRSGYGGGEYGGGEYGGAQQQQPSYQQPGYQTGYGQAGRHDDDSNDYDKHRRHQEGRGYGGAQQAYEQPSSSQSGYGQAPSSGYAPSYGGRDDTFGAERLNIGHGGGHKRDDSDSDDGRKRHGRHEHGGRY